MTKTTKSFRFSEASLERLERLAEDAEISQTAYLEQLLKKEDEKFSRKTKKPRS